MAETLAFPCTLGYSELPKPTANFSQMVAMWLLEKRLLAISFQC